jgi:peptidoglycan/LPS O-acetylase OafA/YrhL
MERVAALDLLRGLAALSVAIPHFIMLKAAVGSAEIVSVLAVEVFFVLSGFVLGPQILRCLRSSRASDLGVFLARRWMRTIPPYLFALVLISMIVRHIEPADFVRYALYVENLFAQYNVKDYFPVAWSLSIEEWFYVAFPALLMAAAWCFRNNRDGLAVVVALCFIAAVTVVRQVFGDLDDWGASVRRVVVFRIDSIAYGFLLFLFVQRVTDGVSDWRAATLKVPAAAGLFIVTASLAAVLMWRIETARAHVAETLLPFAAAGFGMSAILLSYALRDVFQHSRPLAACCYFLGRVSYSLYLFHLSVAMTITPHLVGLPLVLQASIYLGVCIALSAVFYRLVERPILALRPDYRRRGPGTVIDTMPLAVPAKSSAVA